MYIFSLCVQLLIMMCITISYASAQTTNICPSGSLSSSIVSTSSSGTYYAASCTFSGLVSINGRTIPSGSSSSVVIILTQNRIQSSSTLQLLAPTTPSTADNSVPLRVTVYNNSFFESSFRLQGCLPPNSYIIFQQNTLAASSVNINSGLSTKAVALVTIASNALMYLGENATITILENNLTLVTESVPRAYLIVFTSLSMQKDSAIVISNNSMRLLMANVNGTAAFAIFFQSNGDVIGATATTISFLGDRAAFSIADNSIIVESQATVAAVSALAGYTVGYSTVVIGSAFVVARNAIVLLSRVETTTGMVSFSGEVRVNLLQFVANYISSNFSISLLRFGTLSVLQSNRFDFCQNIFNRTSDGVISKDVIQTVPLNVPSSGSMVINVTDNLFIAANMTSDSRVFRVFSVTTASASPYFTFGGNRFTWLPGGKGTAAELYPTLLASYVIVFITASAAQVPTLTLAAGNESITLEKNMTVTASRPVAKTVSHHPVSTMSRNMSASVSPNASATKLSVASGTITSSASEERSRTAGPNATSSLSHTPIKSRSASPNSSTTLLQAVTRSYTATVTQGKSLTERPNATATRSTTRQVSVTLSNRPSATVTTSGSAKTTVTIVAMTLSYVDTPTNSAVYTSSHILTYSPSTSSTGLVSPSVSRRLTRSSMATRSTTLTNSHMPSPTILAPASGSAAVSATLSPGYTNSLQLRRTQTRAVTNFSSSQNVQRTQSKSRSSELSPSHTSLPSHTFLPTESSPHSLTPNLTESGPMIRSRTVAATHTMTIRVEPPRGNSIPDGQSGLWILAALVTSFILFLDI